LILDFQTNSLITVESIGKGLWRIVARTDDNLFSAEVTLEVKTPSLDIRQARLEMRRDVLGTVPDLTEPAGRLIGVRVGPGMTKIVRQLVGGNDGSPRVAGMVLDAMEMLVNAMTVPELRKAAEQGGAPIKAQNDGPKVYLNDVVIGEETVKIMAANPRLKDSCAAFQDL
jgi:hypothetical protein